MVKFAGNTIEKVMDFLTKTVLPFFRYRLKQIESHVMHADAVQQKQLSRLIDVSKQTEWGKKYDYKSIRNYETFQERIPIQQYDDVKPYVERMLQGEQGLIWPTPVKWFAKSSGTTNDKSKYLPVSKEILWRCHYKGGFDAVALYLGNNPSSNFFGRKGLILGGSHKPVALNQHAHCGDLSAVLLQQLNPLVNLVRVPPKRIILMDEWESKIKAIVENTWNKDLNSISGVPSWMLVLIKALLERTGKESLTEVWPNLEVFFHGGISFSPYRAQYKALIPSDKMHYVETYNASEGFFGIQSDLNDPSMLLTLDYGIFYEFIPMSEIEREQPTVLPLEAVATGVNYAMVITTCGGLWRYLIGDTIRFTSTNPYKFIITGRTKHFINAFGEELMVDNADKGMARACELTGAKVKEYTAAPQFMLNAAQGKHQWFIEFEKMPSSLSEFARILDSTLQQHNSDYEAKRYRGMSLLPPEIIPAREGVFYEWLKEKGKLGGQHKIPRLSNQRTHIDQLLQLNQNLSDK